MSRIQRSHRRCFHEANPRRRVPSRSHRSSLVVVDCGICHIFASEQTESKCLDGRCKIAIPFFHRLQTLSSVLVNRGHLANMGVGVALQTWANRCDPLGCDRLTRVRTKAQCCLAPRSTTSRDQSTVLCDPSSWPSLLHVVCGLRSLLRLGI